MGTRNQSDFQKIRSCDCYVMFDFIHWSCDREYLKIPLCVPGSCSSPWYYDFQNRVFSKWPFYTDALLWITNYSKLSRVKRLINCGFLSSALRIRSDVHELRMCCIYFLWNVRDKSVKSKRKSWYGCSKSCKLFKTLQIWDW